MFTFMLTFMYTFKVNIYYLKYTYTFFNNYVNIFIFMCYIYVNISIFMCYICNFTNITYIL